MGTARIWVMNISEFLPAESFKLTIERQRALLKEETATQHYGLELNKKDGAGGTWSRDLPNQLQ